MTSLALQALSTQADSVHLIGHNQYMIPQLSVARVWVGLMPVAWVLLSDESLEEWPPAKCCPSVTTVLTRCLLFFWLGAAWVKSRAERPSVSEVN